MLNYHHEPTNTRIETESGNVGSDTPYVKTQIRTRYVDTSVTRYESETVGVWSAQSIHLQTTPDMYAEVVDSVLGDSYVIVKLGHHDNVFMPIEMAEAIVDAMLEDETAAQLIYAEETAP